MVRFSRGRLVVLRMGYPQGIASVPYRHNMGVTPGNCKSLVKDQGPPPLNSVECGNEWWLSLFHKLMLYQLFLESPIFRTGMMGYPNLYAGKPISSSKTTMNFFGRPRRSSRLNDA